MANAFVFDDYFFNITSQSTAPVSALPEVLEFGILTPGHSVAKSVIIKGTRPFRVFRIKCSDHRFKFQSPPSVRDKLHIIPVKFTPDTGPTRLGVVDAVSARLEVVTDGGEWLAVAYSAHVAKDTFDRMVIQPTPWNSIASRPIQSQIEASIGTERATSSRELIALILVLVLGTVVYLRRVVRRLDRPTSAAFNTGSTRNAAHATSAATTLKAEIRGAYPESISQELAGSRATTNPYSLNIPLAEHVSETSLASPTHRIFGRYRRWWLCLGTTLVAVAALVTLPFKISNLERLTSLLLFETQTEFTCEEIYKRCRDAAYSVETLDRDGTSSKGTGFAVHRDGLIVTNFHVIEDNIAVVATSSDGQRHQVTRVVAVDEDDDVALLRIGVICNNVLSLASSPPSVGSRVVALGHPKGRLVYSLSQGIVSAIRKDGEVDVIQFDAAISKGSSGGPLLDSRCEVVGIAAYSYEDEGDQGLNFAMSAECVKRLLRQVTR